MKKYISLLLSLIMILTLSVGCSSEKNDDKNDKSSFSQKLTVDYHYKNIGESTVSSYNKLCNAVLNYETSCKINLTDIDNISLLFYTSFPLYYLVDNLDKNADNTGIIISYKLSEQEHFEKIKQFNDAVEELRLECGHGKVSKDVFLLNVYSYIAQNFTIDVNTTTVAETAITKKGYSSSLSGLFEYLVLSEDIPACHVIKMKNNAPSSMLSCAMLNGNFYFFDVSQEISNTSGRGLKYFAMSSKRALSGKASLCYTDNTELETLDDETFYQLKDCVSFSLDGKTLKANMSDKSFKEFELS